MRQKTIEKLAELDRYKTDVIVSFRRSFREMEAGEKASRRVVNELDRINGHPIDPTRPRHPEAP